MSEPYVKCPCGFEARTGNAEQLLKEHKCPTPPSVVWAIVSVPLGFLAMIVIVAWMVA